MAKKGKNSSGKKYPAKNLLISFIITLVLIALFFYLLETLRSSLPQDQEITETKHHIPEQVEPVQQNPKKPEPPRIEQPPQQQNLQKVYSSASVPITKTTIIPPPGKHRKRKPDEEPRVAIIIDDMGGNLKEAETLLAIHIPITFSIIPGMAHDKEVASAVNGRGYEVMVHIPMEPKDYPQRRLEQNGLLLSMSNGEIETRVNRDLQNVPYARGANNHMGSRFTEDQGKMDVVLAVLKRHRFFFVDSKTSPASVGERLAHERGIKSASRDVFLDNIQESGAIKVQLEQLMALARRRGQAIGICHPHQVTIKTLVDQLPVLQAQGVKFVFASEMVR